MSRPRVATLLPAVLVVALVVVFLGRWSAHRADSAQLAGIAQIRKEVGPLDGKALDAYRLAPTFDCLLYRQGKVRFARELCFGPSGGLVEAIDRTGPVPSIRSVRYEPGLARIHVAPALILRLLRRLGAGQYLAGARDDVPVGFVDIGPVLRKRLKKPQEHRAGTRTIAA